MTNYRVPIVQSAGHRTALADGTTDDGATPRTCRIRRRACNGGLCRVSVAFVASHIPVVSSTSSVTQLWQLD
jgi:hypothetical protein